KPLSRFSEFISKKNAFKEYQSVRPRLIENPKSFSDHVNNQDVLHQGSKLSRRAFLLNMINKRSHGPPALNNASLPSIQKNIKRSPEENTPKKLSQQFKISPESVRRIIHSKFVPTPEISMRQNQKILGNLIKFKAEMKVKRKEEKKLMKLKKKKWSKDSFLAVKKPKQKQKKDRFLKVLNAVQK
ncbi:10159_t:CDS:2, partial [Racocetra fulgida]